MYRKRLQSKFHIILACSVLGPEYGNGNRKVTFLNTQSSYICQLEAICKLTFILHTDFNFSPCSYAEFGKCLFHSAPEQTVACCRNTRTHRACVIKIFSNLYSTMCWYTIMLQESCWFQTSLTQIWKKPCLKHIEISKVTNTCMGHTVA